MENYFGRMSEDFDSYKKDAGRKFVDEYDPCFDFKRKENLEGCDTSIHTQRLLMRCPK